MDAQSVRKAAAALLDVRRGEPPIEALPDGCQPGSLAEAYAIQDELARHLSPIAGWKIAPMSDGSGLWCAPLHRESFAGGPRIDGRTLRKALVEAEIAFRFTRDVPAGIGVEALTEAMEMVPLFEILSPRLTELSTGPFFSHLADGYGSHGVKLGAPVADWASLDRAALSFSIEVDGKPIDQFELGPKLDYAVGLMARFAERFEGRAMFMPAGTVVTTGAMRVLSPGHRMVADYGMLGMNELIIDNVEEIGRD